MIVPAHTLPLGTKVRVKCYGSCTVDWERKLSPRELQEVDVYLIGRRREADRLSVCFGFDTEVLGGMGNIDAKIAREPRNFIHNARELANYAWWLDGGRTVKLPHLNPDQRCGMCSIPLPHVEKMNAPICRSCRMLVELGV